MGGGVRSCRGVVGEALRRSERRWPSCSISITAKMADRYRDLMLREQQRCGRTPTCVCGVAPGTNKIEAHLKLPTGEALDAWADELRAIQLRPAQAPADWYPDPHGQHRLRYFDGASWTDHVAD